MWFCVWHFPHEQELRVFQYYDSSGLLHCYERMSESPALLYVRPTVNTFLSDSLSFHFQFREADDNDFPPFLVLRGFVFPSQMKPCKDQHTLKPWEAAFTYFNFKQTLPNHAHRVQPGVQGWKHQVFRLRKFFSPHSFFTTVVDSVLR